MQNTTKKFLGIVGLALVVLLTICAYLIPTEGAYAEESTVIAGTDTLRVTVYGEDQYPSIVIDSPTTEELTTSPEIPITFTYENASRVDFILKYEDEDGNPVEVALPSFTPDPSTLDPEFGYASGTDTVTPDIRALGLTYGHYVLEVKSGSPIGESTGDSIEFDYVPAIVTQTGTDENTNDPIVEVEHDEGVKKVEIMPVDENGNPLLDEPIVVEIAPDGSGDYPAGTETVTLPFTGGGISTGDYTLIVTAYDDTDEPIDSPRDSYPVNYVQPLAPDVPDTGVFTGGLNIAKSDYIITALLVFGIASVAALRITHVYNYRYTIIDLNILCKIGAK